MRPTRQQAEDAVRTLLAYTGDDPTRDGLKDTPSRVVRAYDEMFRGYGEHPEKHLDRTFDDVEHYDEIVLVSNIEFESMCEHHMASIFGVAHVGYLPGDSVVGLSKLARLVDGFAKRLQVQERMTRQIASSIERELGARGVCVIIEAEHQCMSTRGVHKRGTVTTTSSMLGCFREDHAARAEVLELIRRGRRI